MKIEFHTKFVQTYEAWLVCDVDVQHPMGFIPQRYLHSIFTFVQNKVGPIWGKLCKSIKIIESEIFPHF
jgi:hypothetical protein